MIAVFDTNIVIDALNGSCLATSFAAQPRPASPQTVVVKGPTRVDLRGIVPEIGQGRPQDAEELYHQAFKLNADRDPAHKDYANLLAKLGWPDDAPAHYNYALLLANQGRPQEAEEHYQQALKLNPDLADAHNNYAVLLEGQGRPQEAEENYRRARELGLSDTE